MTDPRTPTLDEPRTEAGRRLYDSVRIHNVEQRCAADDRHDARWLTAILAIEAAALDEVERVVRELPTDFRGDGHGSGWYYVNRDRVLQAICQLRGKA